MGISCLRQHRFLFLKGDTGKSLPVDGYYPERSLVVEYHEQQHTKSVPFFDRRVTVSGTSRDVQRQRYDERRRRVLPEYGIHLVELSFEEFEHSSSKRLKRRRQRDLLILESKLRRWILVR